MDDRSLQKQGCKFGPRAADGSTSFHLVCEVYPFVAVVGMCPFGPVPFEWAAFGFPKLEAPFFGFRDSSVGAVLATYQVFQSTPG